MVQLAGPSRNPLEEVAGTQSVGRTLAVLEYFRQYDRDLRISDVSEGLGLTMSTTHRLIRALVSGGYLAQSEETERYHLGRSAVILGQAASERLGLHRAQGVLDRLRDYSGESVNLGVREGDSMVVLIRSESKSPLRFTQDPGSRLPVHASSMGKIALAYGRRSIAEEVDNLPVPLVALTPKTIVSKVKLRYELTATRERGYSIDHEEAIEGARCLSAPILADDGHLLASVAIQGPATRMSSSAMQKYAPELISAAREIADLLPSARQP